MTFILPSFGASAISAVPGGGGGGGASYSNTYSVDFDGSDDFLSIPHASSLTIAGNMSITAWVKRAQLANGEYLPILTKRPSANQLTNYSFYLDALDGSGAGGLRFYDGSTVTSPTGGTAIPANTWTHVAITIESGVANGTKWYVNGSQESSTSSFTINKSNTDPVLVGKLGAANIYGEGLIDEVALFNSALSGSDITAIYNSGVPADISSLSPVGWWRMGDNDSGSGTTITDQGVDANGNPSGNDGTLTNGPTFVQGVPSVPAAYSNTYSLDFDGTDDYLATTYQYGSATQFTYSFWIKTTDTGNSHWVGNSLSGANDTRFHFGTKGGAYYVLLGNSSGQYQVANAGSASAVTDGNWHHMVFQWDGTNTNGVNLYVDGNTTPVFTYTSNRASNASTAPLNFGIGWGGGYYAYDGLMDEAALFESILSTSDITTLYNSGVPGDISSLNPVGWWRMGDNDGGTGTTITDQGSGGNDGTLTNGPTFSTDVPT